MPVPKAASELDDLLLRIDYASLTINYYGHASPGTAASSALWRIKRETLDSQSRTTIIEYADGDASFDNVWDDRATLSFS